MANPAACEANDARKSKRADRACEQLALSKNEFRGEIRAESTPSLPRKQPFSTVAAAEMEWKREPKIRLDDCTDVGENCLLRSIAVPMFGDERGAERE